MINIKNIGDSIGIGVGAGYCFDNDSSICLENELQQTSSGFYSNITYYVGTLCVLFLMNIFMYGCIHTYLRKYNSYIELIPRDKFYVLKNLCKSFILCMLMIAGTPIVYGVIFNNYWNNAMIHFLGTVYVSTDLTGLITIRRLSMATKIHHACVLIFGFVSVSSDYNEPSIARAMLVLTFFSIIPYSVNGYLGLRYLKQKDIQELVIDLCLYTYVNSVIVNFVFQHLYILYWLSDSYWILRMVYMGLYYLILNDDIKLIKYLYYKFRVTHGYYSDTNIMAFFSLF